MRAVRAPCLVIAVAGVCIAVYALFFVIDWQRTRASLRETLALTCPGVLEESGTYNDGDPFWTWDNQAGASCSKYNASADWDCYCPTPTPAP